MAPPHIPLPLSFGQKKATETVGSSDAVAAAIEDSSSASATHRKRSARSTYRRSGKWSVAEENYARCMILHFSKGLLQLRSGETLRLYMSKKLFCDPMRITKRFAGTGALMKEISQSRQHCGAIELALAKSQLDALEKEFLAEVKAEQDAVRSKRHGSTAVRLSTPVASVSSSSSSNSTQSSSGGSILRRQGSSLPTQGPSEVVSQPQQQREQNSTPDNSPAPPMATSMDTSNVSALLLQILASTQQTVQQPQQVAPVVQQQPGLDPTLLLAVLSQLSGGQANQQQQITFSAANNNDNTLLSALSSLQGLQQQPQTPQVNPITQLLLLQHQQQQQQTTTHQPQVNHPGILQNLAQLISSSPTAAPAVAPQDAQLFLNFVNSCSNNNNTS